MLGRTIRIAHLCSPKRATPRLKAAPVSSPRLGLSYGWYVFHHTIGLYHQPGQTKGLKIAIAAPNLLFVAKPGKHRQFGHLSPTWASATLYLFFLVWPLSVFLIIMSTYYLLSLLTTLLRA